MPPTAAALVSLLDQQHEERLWRSYVSMALWRMDRVWGGKGFPTFEESIRPQETRSADEIKAKILKGLRGEVKEEHGSI